MKPHSLAACIFIILLSCNNGKNSPLTDGIWKIRKVEILKDKELKKVIDTGFQYWSFNKHALIEIFDKEKIQNTLHIRIGKSSIKSFDTSGAVKEEFVIEELDNQYLALSSRQKLQDEEYHIIYYLDKVRDGGATKKMLLQ